MAPILLFLFEKNNKNDTHYFNSQMTDKKLRMEKSPIAYTIVLAIALAITQLASVILFGRFIDPFYKIDFFARILTMVIWGLIIYYFGIYRYIKIGKPSLIWLLFSVLFAILTVFGLDYIVAAMAGKKLPDYDMSKLPYLSIRILIGPILEEIIFRGIPIEILLRSGNKKWIAILLTSVIFSLVHLPGIFAISSFFFSIGLALFYLKTRNLIYCIIVHVFSNLLIVFL